MGVMQSQAADMVGIFPGGSVFPMMLGGMLGNDQACGDVGYDLVSYVAMREYMATLSSCSSLLFNITLTKELTGCLLILITSRKVMVWVTQDQMVRY
jgi:hypothetical protein